MSGHSACANNAIPRISHQRGSRVGNQGSALPQFQTAEDGRNAFPLIVLEKTVQSPFDREALPLEEQSGATGILGQHQVSLFQNVPGSGAEVTRVAKGRGHDPQSGGSQMHRKYVPV